jgi:DNA-binding response OmpR family regulator
MSELKNLRILYVEDDEATREALSKFLSRRVGKVYAASDGEEGVRKFLEYRPNLLIVDLIMPGMSGLEMISEVRNQDKECRILITSTVNEINTVLEAVDMGIDHYIVKPIDMEDLEKKLEVTARSFISREAKTHSLSFMNLDNVRLAEDMIRREFLKIMKTYSGKGPQDVKVLLFENQAEIIALDTATVMEKTIAFNRRNLTVIEQFRRVFYEEISGQLEECVELATGYKVRVSSVFVDGLKRLDKIILTIV